MRILQINAVYEYSSTGRTTTELHQYLLSQGHESYVAANNVPRTEGNIIKIGNTIDHRLHSLLSHLTGKQGYYSYFATKKLLKQITRIKPDVVHLRVLHSNSINIPLLLDYLGKNNIPTVVTLHDCWFFTGHCCYFTDAKCDHWKSGCGCCPDLKNWNRSWFFDNTQANLADKKRLFSGIKNLAIIGVSDWVTSFIKDSVLKDAKIVKRIYNWIDLERFKPTESDIRKRFGLENDFVVLGVAQNWGVQKGILDVKEVANRMPECKFLIVGNIPEQYYPLPENILAAGVTSSVQELINYYSCADVFFNPSTRETFGKVTVEALSCGTPVVAYNLTATPELIPDGCGYIADYRNLDTIVSSINLIKETGKESFVQHCVSFVHKNFGKQYLINEYIDVYKTLTLRKKIK